LIGASAAGSLEARATPFSEVTPGFITHAAAIDNLLHHEAVHSVPAWFTTVTIQAMALLGTALVAAMSAAWMNLVSVLLVAVAYWIAAYVALARFHLWIPVIAPVAALGISFGTASLIRFATTGRELRRTRNTLDRYVSPALVNYVLENIDNIKLDGERKELTIFFSDVRNFTTLTEGSEPMELIHLLDEYLHAMTEVIFKYDGIVDKFIGDGILAYWGAFTPGKNHALLAAQASLEMLEKLEELNQKWTREGRKTLRIGIGINTGDVVFGNIGRGRKMEFTVIGDPVNLASRLEGLNKDFGTSIIISEFTYNKLGESARVRPLGSVKVKGKTIETAVFELLGFGNAAQAVASAAFEETVAQQNH
jgi:adenylate cyclase